jgi:hypothetical protein
MGVVIEAYLNAKLATAWDRRRFLVALALAAALISVSWRATPNKRQRRKVRPIRFVVWGRLRVPPWLPVSGHGLVLDIDALVFPGLEQAGCRGRLRKLSVPVTFLQVL